MKFPNVMNSFRAKLHLIPKSSKAIQYWNQKLLHSSRTIKDSSYRFAFGKEGLTSEYAQILRQELAEMKRSSKEIFQICTKQSVAVSGQKARKAHHINKVYRNIYGKSYIESTSSRMKNSLPIPFYGLLSAILLKMKEEESTEDE